VASASDTTAFGAGSCALLFPGQGNQFTGMGWGWYRRSQRARTLFARAERVSGLPVRRLCFDGTRDELARTEVTQPCVLVASLAGATVLEEELGAGGRRLRPQLVAGHSLGQLTALVFAGSLSFDRALELVCLRARLMAEAGGGGMATILGLAVERVRGLCAAASGSAVVVASVNGPDHTVVSGEREALAAVGEAARAAGATRVIPLPISIAAHSPAMEGAQAAFAAAVAALELREPRLPVVLNGDARATRSVAAIRAELEGHMCAPVRWWDSVQAIVAAGVEEVVEIGPGRSLTKELCDSLPASVFCLGRSRAVPELRESA
jgi:[acyl-carrier-protein] S-malonyltransferase